MIATYEQPIALRAGPRGHGSSILMTLEPEDLSRLYETYARSLLRFFQRRVHDPELAVDLMSDVFTLALERRHQFRGSDDDQASGWLWSIAQSILSEHERRDENARRGSKRLGKERRQLTDGEIERIEELASSVALRAAVAHSLDQLPSEQRRAVRMRVVEGMTYAEIARRLDLSGEEARTAVTRAMRAMQRMLDRAYEREQTEGL